MFVRFADQLGAAEYTPAQLAEEQRKWNIMNENRAKAGLAPIPMPENLTKDTRFITVGDTEVASPMVQTTRQEMAATADRLRRMVLENKGQPVVQGSPTTPPQAAPPPDVHWSVPPSDTYPPGPSGLPAPGPPMPSKEAVADALKKRAGMAPTPKKSKLPWILGGAAVLGLGWFMFGRK